LVFLNLRKLKAPSVTGFGVLKKGLCIHPKENFVNQPVWKRMILWYKVSIIGTGNIVEIHLVAMVGYCLNSSWSPLK
jgi:hypothetical protein